jgi:hypothetical protein
MHRSRSTSIHLTVVIAVVCLWSGYAAALPVPASGTLSISFTEQPDTAVAPNNAIVVHALLNGVEQCPGSVSATVGCLSSNEAASVNFLASGATPPSVTTWILMQEPGSTVLSDTIAIFPLPTDPTRFKIELTSDADPIPQVGLTPPNCSAPAVNNCLTPVTELADGNRFSFTFGNLSVSVLAISDTDEVVPNVPEPTTLLLTGSGVFLMFGALRRRIAHS